MFVIEVSFLNYYLIFKGKVAKRRSKISPKTCVLCLNAWAKSNGLISHRADDIHLNHRHQYTEKNNERLKLKKSVSWEILSHISHARTLSNCFPLTRLESSTCLFIFVRNDHILCVFYCFLFQTHFWEDIFAYNWPDSKPTRLMMMTTMLHKKVS